MGTIVSRASAMQATQEICAKRKSTNANQILVNMEDTVKIQWVDIDVGVLPELRVQIAKSILTNAIVTRAEMEQLVQMESTVILANASLDLLDPTVRRTSMNAPQTLALMGESVLISKTDSNANARKDSTELAV